jgi:hypothetical protein
MNSFIARSWFFGMIGILTILLSQTSAAQTAVISGKVRDANSNEFLPFTNVFINQTTIGASADKTGSYVLENIPVGSNEIIFSFVGYKSYRLRVDIKPDETRQLDIRLIPEDVMLENVVVTGTRDKVWQKQLKKFETVFLGTNRFSSSCKIINPEVLEFNESAENGRELFTAIASRPLQIENDALGYRIEYHLKNLASTSEGYNINGEVRFEELQTTDDKRIKSWNQNRVEAYQGSIRHLVKSIIEGRAKEEGFNIYTDKKGFENATQRIGTFGAQLEKTVESFSFADKVTSSKDSQEYIIQLKQRLEVHFTKVNTPVKVYSDINYPVSWLQVSGGILRVNSQGVVLNPSNLIVSGSMFQARVADLLPYNYLPGQLTVVNHKENISPLALKLYRMQEKVYIQTDKPYYYPGERVWLKAYMNYRTLDLIDSLSSVLYVELISSDKKILQTRRVFIDGGSGEGSINLPDKLSPGNYILRAYTNWMLNYPSEELFTRVIPVLEEYDRPDVTVFSEVTPESSVSVKWRADNEFYKTRSKIDLGLELRDRSGNPVYAELSVAITDVSQVIEVPQESTILSGFVFKKDDRVGQKQEDNLYKLERGIDVNGIYKNKKRQPARSSFFVSEESTGKLLSVESDKDGKFSANGLLFYDSSSLVFQTPGKKKKFEGEIVLTPREIPSVSNLNFDLPYKVIKTESPQRRKLPQEAIVDTQVEKVIMELPPEERLPLNKQSIPYSYGKPDFTISGEEIVKSSRTSLVDALIGRVPGLTVFNGYLRLGGPSNFQGPSTTEPMLIVDGTQFTSSGSDSNYGRMRQINPEIVERVDVIKYGGAAIFGARGGNGVIVVTTKTADNLGAGTGPSGKDGLSLYKPIVGFSSTPPFYIPDYSRIANKDVYPDVRSIIYWASFITTDNLGNAQISFYAAGTETRYKIVVEGVSAAGEPLRNIFYLQVVK